MRNLTIRNKDHLTEEEFLKQYQPSDYERPSVTVDMLLFTVDEVAQHNIRKVPNKELKILLIKRGNHPYMGCYALPGGFVDIDENLEDAVYRELKEETNIDNVYLEQLYTFGDVNRDPRMRVITAAYMALVDKTNLNPIAADDADEVKWFSVKKHFIQKEELEQQIIEQYSLDLISEDGIEISYIIKETYHFEGINVRKSLQYVNVNDTDELAFDQIKMVDLALERLKNKVEYTAIAFSLMPTYFTLTELQRVYEVILNKKLTKANFRRKIMPMVVETEFEQKVGGHRPAKLFMFNKDWQHKFL